MQSEGWVRQKRSSTIVSVTKESLPCTCGEGKAVLLWSLSCRRVCLHMGQIGKLANWQIGPLGCKISDRPLIIIRARNDSACNGAIAIAIVMVRAGACESVLYYCSYYCSWGAMAVIVGKQQAEADAAEPKAPVSLWRKVEKRQKDKKRWKWKKWSDGELACLVLLSSQPPLISQRDREREREKKRRRQERTRTNQSQSCVGILMQEGRRKKNGLKA